MNKLTKKQTSKTYVPYYHISQKKTALGIAGIVVAVLAAGLALMDAQAQENPTNNVNQVNPAVFYNEDDCRDARDQASSALMVEYYRRSGNLTERRKNIGVGN